MADLVAELPTPSEPAYVSIGDIEGAAEQAGLERPSDAGEDEARTWMLDLAHSTDTGVFVPLPGRFMESFGRDGGDELGWDLTDVHTFAYAEAHPQVAMIVTGDFDEDTLSPELEDLGEGVFSAGSGGDFEQSLQDRTAVRPTGTPLRLAQDGNVIMLDAETDQVRAWAQGEDRVTFADDEEMIAVAEALDDQDVYGAVLTTWVGPLGPIPGAAAEAVEEMAIEEPFGLLGLGWAMDDDEPTVLAVYHFGASDSAERALPQVESVWAEGRSIGTGQPLSEILTLQDITQDGPLVVATLHREHPAGLHNAHSMLLSSDLPFGYLEP